MSLIRGIIEKEKKSGLYKNKKTKDWKSLPTTQLENKNRVKNSAAAKLQAGWDAEMEARQSPAFRYAGKSLSEVDEARKRAGNRVLSAKAQIEQNNRVGNKSGVVRGYRVGNVSADENEKGIAKQRYDLASKREAALDAYFTARMKHDHEKKQKSTIEDIVARARGDANFSDIVRRGRFAGTPYGTESEKAAAYINNLYASQRAGMTREDQLKHLADVDKESYTMTDFQRSRYDVLTEDEKNIIRYFAAKHDWDTVQRYLDAKEQIVNARAQKIQDEETREFAEKHPFVGAAAHALDKLSAPAAFFETAGQAIKNEVTGDYVPIDKNSAAFSGVHNRAALGEGVGNTAERSATEYAYRQLKPLGEKVGATEEQIRAAAAKAGEFWRDMANTGVGILDSAVTLPLGPASLAATGLASAGDTTYDALQRGADPKIALAAGTASGAIEAATEKLPLDNILRLGKGGTTGVVKNAAKQVGTTGFWKNVVKQIGTPEFWINAAKQSGIEAIEEGISNVAGNVADQVIMGELSNYSQLVQQFMQQGASREEAERKASYQLYLIDTLKSSLAGGISGGLMATSAQAVGAARQNAARRAASNAVNDAYRAMAQDGMFSDRARQAANTAAAAQQSVLTPQMTVEQFNKARYETVRRNTEQQLDALIEPVRARVQQLESQMSTDPRDPLTAEYTKAKNMLNAYETIRDNRLREIDKMYGMAYTENQERRATWNEENRTKWREQYGRGEAETADAAVYGGRRSSVQRGSVFDAGNVGNAAQTDDEGRKNSPARTYQQLEGTRDEDHGRYRYRFHEVGRENASKNSLSIADEWTQGGFTVRVYDGEVKSIGVNGTSKRGSADAMTLSDGTILLNNNASLPKAEILAHEPIHVYRKTHPEIYLPLADTLETGGISIHTPQAMEVLQLLENAYGESYMELNNRKKLYEELIAQISGHHANNPAFAREKFAPLINDYDGLIAAIENAHRTFAEQNSANQASEGSGAFSMPESGERGGKIMEESVGAAVHDPNSYSALQGEYGTIEPGENPARVVDVPKKTDDMHKVRQFTRTMMEAKSVPDALVNDFENMVKNGEFSYESISNDKTMEHAKKRIEHVGFENALKEWNDIVTGKRQLNANGIALGEYLFAEAAHAKDTQLAMKTAQELSAMLTQAGQTVQAARILKKITPEGRLMSAQKSLEYIREQFAKRLNKKSVEIDIPDHIAEQILNARTEAEISEAEKALADHLAAQIPATWLEKWNNWRYLSMLCNPRTHIRNVTGNGLMYAVRRVKDVVKIPLEGIRGKIDPASKTEKTAALFTDAKMREFARNDYAEARNVLNVGDKYGMKYIDKHRRIFKPEWLEAIRKFNSELLDNEDFVFMRANYVSAFAQKAKASGYTTEFLSGDTAEAKSARKACRDYAMEEALKATFRDDNALADLLSRASRVTDDDKWGVILGKMALEGTLPFRKTPMNIVKRGVEYSPAGVLNALVFGARRVKNAGRGLQNAADIQRAQSAQLTKEIDKLAAGLTGTAIAAIGAYLMSRGILRVMGGDDKKENEFEKMTGSQDYSIQIGGHSYTLDWASPSAMPLFVGAETFRAFQKGGASFSDFVTALSTVSNPIIEMSMLQGIQRTISTISGSNNKIADVLVDSLASYAGQGVPTVFGQIARTIDGTRRTTYYPKGSTLPKNIGTFVNRIKAKVPGLSYTLQPYVDAWGREDKSQTNWAVRSLENAISPGYYSKINKTPVDTEIERLVSATSDNDLYPKRAQTSVRVHDKTYYLMPEELTRYQKTMGQTAFNALNDLFRTDAYKKLSSDEQAKAVKDIYDYARDKARDEFISGRQEIKDEPSAAVQKVDGAKKIGIRVEDYFMEKNLLRDGDDSKQTAERLDKLLTAAQRRDFKKKEARRKDHTGCNADRKRRIIMNSDFTAEQKKYLAKSFDLGEKTDYTNERKYYFSQLSDAKRERWAEASRRWDNMTEIQYYNIIDACSGLKKKDEIVRVLQQNGFTPRGADNFYKVVFAPKK
nr:MAG TPA: hypothetical protein [Caudoviricetes sp.]